MTKVTQSQIPLGDFASSSACETFNLGRQVGERLNGGEVLLLSGPLGAGKTMFVKGVCAALGIDAEEVTSPSFTLVNPHSGRLLLYHLDLYRLDEGPSAAHAVDLDELLSDERAVIIIEWAERMGSYAVPLTSWQVAILGDGDMPRRISITSHVTIQNN